MALLFEYLYHWNHQIDVVARCLPEDYEFVYDGFWIEDEIDAVEAWLVEDMRAHPDWVTSTNFVDTVEDFVIMLDV
jgi:hypothetical protein